MGNGRESNCSTPLFFGYTPREAEVLDPQHVFSSIAVGSDVKRGLRIGAIPRSDRVFAAAVQQTTLAKPDHESGTARLDGQFSIGMLNDKDYLATRVSYS